MVFAEVLSASAALLLLLIRRRGRRLAPPTLAFGSGGVCPDVLLLCSLRGRFGDPAMQGSATPVPARIPPPSWSSPSLPCAFSSRASVSLHTPRQGCLLFRSLLFLVSSTFSHPPSPIHTDPGELHVNIFPSVSHWCRPRSEFAVLPPSEPSGGRAGGAGGRCPAPGTSPRRARPLEGDCRGSPGPCWGCRPRRWGAFRATGVW